MLKKINILSILISSLFINFKTYAASEKACAIWLCAPAGFPSGCAAAHAEMIDRIKKFKPIFPNLSGCKSDIENEYYDGIKEVQGKASYIAPHSICVKQAIRHDRMECIFERYIPEHYVKDTSCRTGNNGLYPSHCYTTVYYIEIKDIETKEKIGKTYYIGLNGNKVKQLPAVSHHDYSTLYTPKKNNLLTKYISKIKDDYENNLELNKEYDTN